MTADMTELVAERRRRFYQALDRLCFIEGRRVTREELTKRAGIERTQYLDHIFRSRSGSVEKWAALAAALDVDAEWLSRGRNPPAWLAESESPLRVQEHTAGYAAPAMRLVGSVSAGDGLVSYSDEARTVPWSPDWALMRVEGWSAYPVVYPHQFVVIDRNRRPAHNDLVVLEVQAETGVKAYLKRYCVAPGSPAGYVLASINAGRNSPWVEPTAILAMVPVVGVLFEAPGQPSSDAEPFTADVLRAL